MQPQQIEHAAPRSRPSRARAGTPSSSVTSSAVPIGVLRRSRLKVCAVSCGRPSSSRPGRTDRVPRIHFTARVVRVHPNSGGAVFKRRTPVRQGSRNMLLLRQYPDRGGGRAAHLFPDARDVPVDQAARPEDLSQLASRRQRTRRCSPPIRASITASSPPGLIWGLVHGNPAFAFQIKTFFLLCVIVAGAYGAADREPAHPLCAGRTRGAGADPAVAGLTRHLRARAHRPCNAPEPFLHHP